MNTIEQAREVAARLREDVEEISKDIYPRYKNPEELMDDAADTIDVLILEVETFHGASKKLIAELAAIVNENPLFNIMHKNFGGKDE